MTRIAKQKIHSVLTTKGVSPAKGFCCVKISQIMIAKLPKEKRFLALLNVSFFYQQISFKPITIMARRFKLRKRSPKCYL